MTTVKKFKFSGHQTFAFRYGWLEKGVRAIMERPTVFSEEDALVQLGVGKNMVESIQHWCLVTQMIEEDPGGKQRTERTLRVSAIAQKLLQDGGWDPFLEDDVSQTWHGAFLVSVWLQCVQGSISKRKSAIKGR